jgi:CheY-like chemotaxis protein
MPIYQIPKHQECGAGRLIYVVDDEPVIASTLAVIIQNSGYDARHFTDPLKALESARVLAPNLLLSDAIMHGMTGVELAIQVSQMYPECKVLLLSGQNPSDDVLAPARKNGHEFEVLVKPLHPRTLLDKLGSMLPTTSAPAND